MLSKRFILWVMNRTFLNPSSITSARETAGPKPAVRKSHLRKPLSEENFWTTSPSVSFRRGCFPLDWRLDGSCRAFRLQAETGSLTTRWPRPHGTVTGTKRPLRAVREIPARRRAGSSAKIGKLIRPGNQATEQMGKSPDETRRDVLFRA